jgi:hypothetical protein
MISPFFMDWTFILILPAMAFAGWAQMKVKSTYAKYAQVGTRNRMTGADVAKAILRDEGIALSSDPLSEDASAGNDACGLEMTPGQLSDHYDPGAKMLRLSEDVYHGQSVAALGIAAHEVGHAIQHARGYAPLHLRSFVYPACSLGSNLAWPLLLIGFFISAGAEHAGGFGPMLMNLGILFFAGSVAFTVITLPVEFNASSRAMRALANGGYLEEDELKGAKKVLSAAAMTYVAAAAMAIMQLLRMIIIARGSQR